ncbi:MAG: hypothetical protein JW982_14560 [Spirochaetes bacterium]|nr:hypothetical protein [Spirochaetota bacterium]
MKILYFVVEAYPRETALKAVVLIEQLKKCIKNVKIELIIFSDTRLNSEKIGYLASGVTAVTGKEVRDLNAADYFETVRSVIDPENCFGITALSSPLSDEYIPRFSSILKKPFLGACYKIGKSGDDAVLTKERFNGQFSEDNLLDDNGACFTLVAVKEGRPDSARRISEESMTRAQVKTAEIPFEKTDVIYNPHKNKKDIREFRSFIAVSSDIKRTDICEREAEVIAKNILGVKAGDNSAVLNKLAGPEREISLTARPVNCSFLLNFGMKGLPSEVNAVTSRGPVVFVGKNNKNLFSRLSDIIINTDPESFLIRFSSEIEKYSRY